MESFGVFYLLLGLFALVIVVLWILMPFAIFGTKDKLQTLIDETVATRKVLTDILEALKK